jgi:hypothetical protein
LTPSGHCYKPLVRNSSRIAPSARDEATAEALNIRRGSEPNPAMRPVTSEYRSILRIPTRLKLTVLRKPRRYCSMQERSLRSSSMDFARGGTFISPISTRGICKDRSDV